MQETIEHAYGHSVCVQIHKGDEQGIDLRPYAKLGYEADVMKQIRQAKELNMDIDNYAEKGYDGEQLREIRVSMERGISLSGYLRKGFCGAQLRQIRRGLEEHLPVDIYADTCYNWLQMREIRVGLKNRVNASLYANPFYSCSQMREIRLGMEDGIDVSSYARLLYSRRDMQQMRYQLTKELYNENKELKELVITDEGSNMTILISNNRLEAYIVLPRDDERLNITVSYVENILRRNGVVYGIDREAIDKALQDEKFGEEVLVARGRESSIGEDGRYEFYFNTDPSRKPAELDDGRVDYKNVDIFEEVEEGQVLAKYIPPQEGREGIGVLGLRLPGAKGKEQPVLQGSGFSIDEDGVTYRADIPGIIEYRDGSMYIYETLVIKEEVNATYGNVYFRGCVHIFGNVGANVEVKAQGSITVEGTVEAATITTKGDVLIKNGMVGAGKGSIRAGGNIAGNFFEACDLHAGGNIEAGYLMNSDAVADQKAVMQGRRGSIIGGRTKAPYGIEANNIGNRSQIATEVETGASKEILERIHKVQADCETLSSQLHMLEHKMAGVSAQGKEQMSYRIIEAERLKLQEEVERAKKKCKKEEQILTANSNISVLSRAYAGTILTINQRTKKLESDYKMTTFSMVGNRIVNQ